MLLALSSPTSNLLLEYLRLLTGGIAQIGHDSERAALIYQHEVGGADQAITSATECPTSPGDQCPKVRK